ncbi:MFS transporter [Paenibacillus sp. GbtcB18]|uniref:MFS transporter n=1 Tax=Paenibacillus sp. GbtcB18 TaxID=2824763 RepID=UPI001C2F14FF|nr:MFS transporter [Paenibacillus sp. GbtcB18]
MPFAIYVLGMMIFSMTTAEFTVAGIMPSLSKEFDVSIASVGYLITAYAAGMIVGGPLLAIGLSKVSKKRAFLLISAIFLFGQILGASANSYEMMMVARIITGVSSAACFGISLGICFDLVSPQYRGRAASIVLGGLMVATALGLPAAMLFNQYFGWRSSFWAVVVLVLLSGILGMKVIPTASHSESVSLRSELASFKNPNLWAAFATSLLIIGATFAAFSYFTPILTDLSGFDTTMVPLILGIYGIATIAGNLVTGRTADQYMMPTLTIGLMLLTAALMTFGLYPRNPYISVLAVIMIGLTGVTLNPAMSTRITRVAGTGTLVTTVHGSIISLGVVVGSSIGGLAIDSGYGLDSPLWVGFILAILGLISLLPYLKRAKASAIMMKSKS